MMNRFFNVSLCGAVAIGALLLMACGDDITEIKRVAQPAVFSAAIDSLPKCDDLAVGKLYASAGKVRFCDGEKWMELDGTSAENGVDGTYCITEEIPSGLVILCEGKKTGILLNGKSGIPGTLGNDGDDGAYCITSSTSAGYDLICDGKIVGSLSNGAPGSSGSKGETGLGCSFVENEDGSYTQKCGEDELVVYAAVCGTESYNPQGNQFCHGVKLYDKCGGKDYNPQKQFCLNNTPTDLCNGDVYTSSQFCLGNKITEKCGEKTYSANEFCEGTTVVERCNGAEFNTTTEFCNSNKIYDYATFGQCGASVYAKSTQFCSGTGVYDKCGSSTYTPTSQFCDARDNQIYKYVKIGSKTWMAQNLNYNYNKGTAKSVCYNNSASNCTKYGRLYLWSAAMDSAAVFGTAGKGCGDTKKCSASGIVRGVCPAGWHLPSKSEFNSLVSSVEGTSVAAKNLKSTSGWRLNQNGVNKYGFNGLPAGNYESAVNSFDNLSISTGYWAMTEADADYAYYLGLNYQVESSTPVTGRKRNGFSIRCVKN